MKMLVWVTAAVALQVTVAEAFKDIECKANSEMMITKPGSYERVVSLVEHGKANAAKLLVHCIVHKGRGVFIVGKPPRGKELFVPVSTGDCVGETYRPHLLCPGDKSDKSNKKNKSHKKLMHSGSPRRIMR